MLELLSGLDDGREHFSIEAESNARVYIEANLVGVHQLLVFLLESLQQIVHLSLVGLGHDLGEQKTISLLTDFPLGNSHQDSSWHAKKRRLTAVLHHVEQSGRVENDATQSSSFISLKFHFQL